MDLEKVSKLIKKPINELQYREDGRIEWVCSHGIGHTVYNPFSNSKYGFVHGCDGCCNDIDVILEEPN